MCIQLFSSTISSILSSILLPDVLIQAEICSANLQPQVYSGCNVCSALICNHPQFNPGLIYAAPEPRISSLCSSVLDMFVFFLLPPWSCGSVGHFALRLYLSLIPRSERNSQLKQYPDRSLHISYKKALLCGPDKSFEFASNITKLKVITDMQ